VDVNAETIELATRITWGHDAVEKYLACIIWLLSDT
jgi:hypothetical protein